MDRYAIFVDAGYVYGAGGELTLDTPYRNQVKLDQARFIKLVREVIEGEFGRPGEFLRLYWYDAAPRGLAQPEHDELAAMAGVKVRLGRLTRQGQKGVDSLVLRDMMRLSAEHAICTAFLVAGDEDLRQGVVEAQDYGVKVVLLGIQPTFGQNQAEPLVHEADELRVLGYDELADCFTRADWSQQAPWGGTEPDAYAIGVRLGQDWVTEHGVADPAEVADGDAIPHEADAAIKRRLLEAGELPDTANLPAAVLEQAAAGFRAALRSAADTSRPERQEGAGVLPANPPAEAGRTSIAPVSVRTVDANAARVDPPAGLPDGQLWAFREGAEFGREWLDGQPQDEVRYLRAGFPMLPREVDVALLHTLVHEMELPPGSHIDDADRKAARAGFWQTLGMELDIGLRRRRGIDLPVIAETDPYRFGLAFAREWASRMDQAEVEHARMLNARRLGLPTDADRLLLRTGAQVFGDPVPDDIRRRMRDGFSQWLSEG